jgi:hypothetical protein
MPDQIAAAPSHSLGKRRHPAPDKLFWAVLTALAAGQLVAFWMLCAHQVRKAQMRDITVQVQRVAVADCLQYIPRATLSHCVSRVDPDRPAAHSVAPVPDNLAAAPVRGGTGMSSSSPVGVSYR